MITITSHHPNGRFCDGLSRRSFLSIGSLAMGGMSMPELLRAQATSSTKVASGGLGHKAIIMVYLPGGPPHQDMYELKTEAPAEIRGEFSPISTCVPGIQICELLRIKSGRSRSWPSKCNGSRTYWRNLSTRRVAYQSQVSVRTGSLLPRH